MYTKAPTKEELKQFLGRARAKRGMFEGDLDEGELEIGQIAGLINDIKPAKQILDEIILEYEQTKQLISTL